MRLLFYDVHKYERDIFEATNSSFHHEIAFVEVRLTLHTADLAKGFDAICSFVNDRLDKETLQKLKNLGVRIIALRSAGFNHVDIRAANSLNMPVVRVPAYSPFAVAEHAIALILTLNRKIHRAHNRVRELNFSLEGLVGFDMHGKFVGVIGTGNIGRVLAGIFNGFGCKILACDTSPNEELRKNGIVEYVDLKTLYANSDIISLHIPLTPKTHHLIDRNAFDLMKRSVILINTSRGGLVDTAALIEALKQRSIGGAGLDVYEEEEEIFFQDLSAQGINDDLLARLLTFPNLIITSHQAFLTAEALGEIAKTTLSNLSDFERGVPIRYQVLCEKC